MYGCESWTIKKAEHRRMDAFELWCWRRLLRGPWTARRSNQSILKNISPGCSLEGLMLKLKLQYFGYLMRRVDSLEKTLMLGGIGGRRRRGWQRMRWLDVHHRLDGHKFEYSLGVGDGQGGLACCKGRTELDMTEGLNWTCRDFINWSIDRHLYTYLFRACLGYTKFTVIETLLLSLFMFLSFYILTPDCRAGYITLRLCAF